MSADPQFFFEPFRLEVRNEQLWRGGEALRLTVKAFRVLRYLVEHAGQLVTKDALFDAVWPAVVVGDGVLSNCIGELRSAMGDVPDSPRFIATVHRRGYRFIAPVTLTDGPPGATARTGSVSLPLPAARAAVMVGRETEIRALNALLEQAVQGQRQVAFITGEAGIGKTTVVDAFLNATSDAPPHAVAWGQCVEHYGAGEPYLPIFDALGRLCRTPGHERLVGLLAEHAPAWLMQMPGLPGPVDLEALQRKGRGATRERMLRELAETLEVVAAEQPLVLVLEDLHWSDHATLDLIAWLARRREPARLLLLATYRPVDVIVHGHPLRALKQDLALHGQCVELRLEGLAEDSMAAYLASRFPNCRFPEGLARTLHRHTEGQPLFVVQTVDAWVQQGWLAEVADQWVMQVEVEAVRTGVPESLRQMIVQQFEGLGPDEQAVLEAASVVGVEFTTDAVAAAVEGSVEHVEDRCEALARRGQFLRRGGEQEWPDGTVAGRYAFLHALHQQVVYQRVPIGRRMQIHRRVGMRGEAAYAGQANERAAELALHFDRGRDFARAVRYLRQAADNARGRHAYHEATTHLTRAAELLRRLAPSLEHTREELAVQLALGTAGSALKGYAAPEVEQAYLRAHELCDQAGDPLARFRVLSGMRALYLQRCELNRARDLGEQCLALAREQDSPALVASARLGQGLISYYSGRFADARTEFEAGLALRATQRRSVHAAEYRQEPAAWYRDYIAWSLWILGYPDQALRCSRDNLARAQELVQPISLVHALCASAVLHQLRREARLARERAEAALVLANEHGFPFFSAWAEMLCGWARAALGEGETGLAQLQHGLAAHRATAAVLARPYYLVLLAEAYAQSGQVDAGLGALDEAAAEMDQYGSHSYDAELYRLRGDLLLQADGADSDLSGHVDAEEQLRRALEIAHQQTANSYALRAAMSLARLWQRQGKRAEAFELLAPVYRWFTEGFDTADLEQARAVLSQLAPAGVPQTPFREA